jgi:hypothetical protein
MATLQTRNGSFRLLFQFEGKQHPLTIGTVNLTEARQWKARAENLLMRVKQRMLEVPVGCTIQDFILHDGRPPAAANLTKVRNTTLEQLREAYEKVFSGGAIEANTLATAKIHLGHIETTLGKSFPMAALTLAKLQEHLDRRGKKVAAVTIKKEIDTLRAVWNWGQRSGLVSGVFPCAGLVCSKGVDQPTADAEHPAFEFRSTHGVIISTRLRRLAIMRTTLWTCSLVIRPIGANSLIVLRPLFIAPNVAFGPAICTVSSAIHFNLWAKKPAAVQKIGI